MNLKIAITLFVLLILLHCIGAAGICISGKKAWSDDAWNVLGGIWIGVLISATISFFMAMLG